MLNVLVLTRYDRLGASSRVRFLQFLTALAARGMSFDVWPFFDDDYIRSLYGGKRAKATTIMAAYLKRLGALMRAHRYDLIWLEKEALPWLPAAIETTLLRGVPYIVDLDDAWFHRYDRNPSPVVRTLMAGKIDAVMHRAAAVVVGNDYLAERARRAQASHVKVIPSVIDFDRYTPTILADAAGSGRKTPIVVGWIGTPITAPYLAQIEPAFRAIAATRAVELHVVGTAAPPAFAGLPVKNIAWNEDTEVEVIAAFDIGIMPLANTDWERGKCAYKLLQVMAAGRPVVASSVGANAVVVRDGVNGYLADSSDQWVEALTALIDDAGLRARLGRRAQQTVENHYTIARVLPQLASVLAKAPLPDAAWRRDLDNAQ
jgi:glycosyltransferase involved in cell wall biosynthesis